ncbi:MAG: ABC transporter permease [Rhodospirillales bacterium]|jgi:ABC-type dipeptide/oligopeptide/nickel transport system permease component|nr:ABC transporter permease [Rhodospirillales bacterium]
MIKYFLRRLVMLIPVLILVLVIIFSLARIIPGDPAASLLGPGATNEQIEALRAQLHLDDHLFKQFTSYASGLFVGDMGSSMKTGRPVFDEILSRLPATLELSIIATLMALVIGIPSGVFSAIRANTAFDHANRAFSLVGVSAPAFLLALILQLIFGVYLGWLPVSGRLSPYIIADPITGFIILDGIISGNYELAWDGFLHVLLPASVLAAFLGATIGRFVRTSMLEVLGEDYIRTARAKGLAERIVIFVHALRNSLLPAVTIVGLKFAEMLGGAILTETVFAWPGIGRFMFEAIKNRDYPVIQGNTLVFALLFMLTSLIVDALYGYLDPRIRTRISR